MLPRPPSSTLFPYTTLFRSVLVAIVGAEDVLLALRPLDRAAAGVLSKLPHLRAARFGGQGHGRRCDAAECRQQQRGVRSEEHTSELQSQSNLVCRLLLEKKK